MTDLLRLFAFYVNKLNLWAQYTFNNGGGLLSSMLLLFLKCCGNPEICQGEQNVA